ncbi:DeoR/GlpR transcriptional regulator [Agrobacterium larrymoorei]|uniref:DeoR/GlpR family DNA-binding transcription regulator n=1 Tax=Agrobacterium larrymoorei TaxID=160699 RepID=UPI001571E041|nr:DeoR/GlpR family DNA-binding transcription regulator [Agrobacterium larrymoorei]NTJ43370.1 DeoR/GlpR transcriptional regulator [Agrobacterium larrymoorei]
MSKIDQFVSERQAQILAELQRNGRVFAHQLAESFAVSGDTVRRDLREMAARGECERVYGGALLAGGTTSPLKNRLEESMDRKTALGRVASRFFLDGMVVFIDAGSTNLAIARCIPTNVRLTVVTNTPTIAAELSGRADIELVVIGGRIDPAVGAAIDTTALRQLEAVRPDLCILGACGLTLENGLTADVFEDAVFKRLACAASLRTLAAVTTEKLGHRAAFHVHPLKAPLSLVLESDAEPHFIDRFTANRVEVYQPD